VCSCHLGWYSVDCSSSFCSGPVSITAASGSISDHRTSDPYLPNSQCSWQIHSADGGPLTIYFDSFQLQSHCPAGTVGFSATCTDLVTLFDGTSTSSPAAYYGGYVPPRPYVTSSGAALLQFSTDSTVEAAGFTAHFYSMSMCPQACSGNGFCVSNGTVGNCTCFGGWSGANCNSTAIQATDLTISYQSALSSTVAFVWYYYAFSVTEPLPVSLDFDLLTPTTDLLNAVNMEVRYGQPPNETNYDYLAFSTSLTNRSVSVSLPIAGIYYAGVYSHFTGLPLVITISPGCHSSPGCLGRCDNSTSFTCNCSAGTTGRTCNVSVTATPMPTTTAPVTTLTTTPLPPNSTAPVSPPPYSPSESDAAQTAVLVAVSVIVVVGMLAGALCVFWHCYRKRKQQQQQQQPTTLSDGGVPLAGNAAARGNGVELQNRSAAENKNYNRFGDEDA